MNPSPATTAAAEINRLHEEAKGGSIASRKALHGALGPDSTPDIRHVSGRTYEDRNLTLLRKE